MTSTINRRDWFKFAGAGVFATSIAREDLRPVNAQDSTADSALIVRTATPYNAEPPLSKLVERWITPEPAFFVRSHGTTPKLDADNFSLSISGLVEKPLTLTIAELKKRFSSTSATATLTCAGNRRTEFNRVKKVGGVQWDAGAIGNAEWQGVRLSEVLKMVGVKPGAKHVWFEGLDEITEKGETFPFGGSISIEKALSDTPSVPGCLLATEMNGKPLTAHHGFPLRTIVPGYIGARSVKWLSKIVVSDQPSPNHYLAHAYKVITEDTPEAVHAAEPIYEFVMNSIACNPSSNFVASGDRMTVKGVALSSGKTGSNLKRVEISSDGGESWHSAQFTSPIRDFCWVHWAVDVSITDKVESLLIRAIDASDEAQPKETPWNLKGYQYNGWHKLTVKRG